MFVWWFFLYIRYVCLSIHLVRLSLCVCFFVCFVLFLLFVSYGFGVFGVGFFGGGWGGGGWVGEGRECFSFRGWGLCLIFFCSVFHSTLSFFLPTCNPPPPPPPYPPLNPPSSSPSLSRPPHSHLHTCHPPSVIWIMKAATPQIAELVSDIIPAAITRHHDHWVTAAIYPQTSCRWPSGKGILLKNSRLRFRTHTNHTGDSEMDTLVATLPDTWGRYHGGRRPSSDDSFHSPTINPPSALDKPCIMKRYHRRRTTRWGVIAHLPTMVTLHSIWFVECRWWNDGWTVKTVVTWRSSASMIPAPGRSLIPSVITSSSQCRACSHNLIVSVWNTRA